MLGGNWRDRFCEGLQFGRGLIGFAALYLPQTFRADWPSAVWNNEAANMCNRWRQRQIQIQIQSEDKDKGLLVVRGPGNCNSHKGIRIRIHGLPTAFLRFTSHHSPLGNRLFEFPLPKLLILINEAVVVRPLYGRKDYPAPKKIYLGFCPSSSPWNASNHRRIDLPLWQYMGDIYM